MLLATVLMILGGTIYALMLLKKARGKSDFSWNLFWNKNAVSIIVNYVIGTTLIIATYYYNPDLDIKFESYDITGAFWAMCGFLAQPIWKFLADEFQSLRNKFKSKGV